MQSTIVRKIIIIITGGWNGNYLTGVLLYDPEADPWTPVGQLATGRGHHGMSLVPKETADYCV